MLMSTMSSLKISISIKRTLLLMSWLSSLAFKKKPDKPKERDERQNKKTGPTKLLSWDIMKHNALQTEL